MDTTGNAKPPPERIPAARMPKPTPARPPGPPTAPPPGPPSPPSMPPVPSPPPFPQLPRRREVLEISVRRRMLWVGSAAFPLHNLSRVEATELNPRRGAALLNFLKWSAIVAVAYVALMAGSDKDPKDSGSLSTLLLVGAIALALFLTAILQPAKPILAVETAGGSCAVVTLPSVDELRTIAGLIVYAIDHPEAEFTAYVNQLTTYNGPVFNQSGGMNTGIRL
ncbi:DUF6232 family protein [Streptomyces sp. NPDC005576]|uniref:DUF6232 family protein n=1 Tax=Streptomyces sp. NPDC005576 TaxID=3364726 RepID=UPI0036CE51AF